MLCIFITVYLVIVFFPHLKRVLICLFKTNFKLNFQPLYIKVQLQCFDSDRSLIFLASFLYDVGIFPSLSELCFCYFLVVGNFD